METASLSLSLSKSQQLFFPLSKSHYCCNFFQTTLHLFYLEILFTNHNQNTAIVASLLAPGPQVDLCLLHPLIVCLSVCLSVTALVLCRHIKDYLGGSGQTLSKYYLKYILFWRIQKYIYLYFQTPKNKYIFTYI